MMSLLVALLVAAVTVVAQTPPQPSQQPAQQPAGPPPTEVFVAPLTTSPEGLRVGTPENISNAPGYDNQPFFAPDGASLFFTSARGAESAKCGSPQTDVYRYDFASRAATRVTRTTDCEYSPTVMPDGRHLSVIRVEPDGTQRLWRFTTAGESPAVILPDVKPVGYHAWLDADTVVLFVLGQPATLQVADVRSGKSEVVASDIGQSIQKIPSGGVSFVQQAGEGADRTLTVTKVSRQDGKFVATPLTAAVAGARQAHVAWMPDGTLLMAHDGTLHAWKPGETGWRAVAELSRLGLRNVTRLAVSPMGDRLALVATP